MTRLRIGYYLTNRSMGGTEKHILTLVDHLNLEAYDVTMFCPLSEELDPFYKALERRGAQLCIIDHHLNQQDKPVPKKKGHLPLSAAAFPWIRRHLPLPLAEPIRVIRQMATGLPAIVRIRAQLAAAKLDVIHFHAGGLESLYKPIIASRLARIPTRLLTIHNSVQKDPDSGPVVEWIALRSVNRIITVSDYVRKTLVTNKRVAPRRVVVIPLGIEVPRSGASMDRIAGRRELRLADGAPVVGVLARLDHLKGVDLLILAAPVIKVRVPGVKIVLIGDGPEEHALRKLAEDQGVADIVAFVGYRSDAASLMRAFDVLAVPSRDEGFSLTAIEAMACGRPVVATDVGEVPCIISDGVTGLLVPPENISALAGAVIRLLTDPREAEGMGRAGRDRVRTQFPEKTMLERTFSLYRAPSLASSGLEPFGERTHHDSV